MKQRWFELKTQSQVIVSRYGVTEGIQESLDYIPGSAFIGVVAGLWDKLDEALLIDGRLSISNALLYGGKQPELWLPVPLSYHKPKYNDDLSNDSILNGIYDLQKYQHMQLKQMRREFIAPTESLYTTIPKYVTVKTAIDRKKYGTAKKENLFTYESLPEGLVFRFHVTADDDVSDSQFNLVCERLQQTVRIGRSRTAEYGSVKISPVEIKDHTAGAPVEWKQYPNSVVLYFTSDYAREISIGPSMIPSGPDFFLDENAKVNWKQTYIRYRNYSPWNRHFQFRMPMRHVISKGSVVVFDTDETWTQTKLQELQNKLDTGVGSYINEGLGMILVNPKFLITEEKLTLRKFDLENHLKQHCFATAPSDQIQMDSPLLRHLNNRVNAINRSGDAKQLGLKWSKNWLKFMQALKKDNAPIPGKTQWSNLREIAVRFRLSDTNATKNFEAFKKALEQHCTRPQTDDPSHHKSTRHKFWDTDILIRLPDGTPNSLSLFNRILEDIKDIDIVKSNEKMPGLIIDAFIQAVVEITRTLDRNEDGR